MTRAFRGLRDQNRVFESLSAVQGFPMVFTRIGEPEQMEVLHVSANYFRTLGIDAAQGRTFLGDDEQPGRERVAVLGHDFRQRRFGGDQAVLGKTLALDDQPYTVVGVLPPRAHEYLESQLWVPLVLERNPAVSVLIVARLKQDVSLQQAQAEMDVLAPRLNQRPGWGLNVVSMHEDFVGRLRPDKQHYLTSLRYRMTSPSDLVPGA